MKNETEETVEEMLARQEKEAQEKANAKYGGLFASIAEVDKVLSAFNHILDAAGRLPDVEAERDMWRNRYNEFVNSSIGSAQKQNAEILKAFIKRTQEGLKSGK